MRDHFVGAMLGLACGDALGAPLEFKAAKPSERVQGKQREMTGGGLWEPGEWTDDTGMALCVADGILLNPINPVPPTGENFLVWQKTAKDVGTTISAALKGYNGDWVKAAQSTPNAQQGKAAGNGSLMRTLPVALAYAETETLLRESARISAMTHWDSQAETCCAIYCLWIRAVLQGESIRGGWHTALWQAHSVAESHGATAETPGMVSPSDSLWKRMAKVDSLNYHQLQPSGYAGYSVECLEAAAWCCLFGGTMERTLTEAVNLGGETDTIAAVAGGVAGAFYGRAAIPKCWLTSLYQRERIESTANALAELRHQLIYATPVLLHKPFKFDEVADRLFAGRNPLTMQDIESLVARGVTHILSLYEGWEWERSDRFGREAVATIERMGLQRVLRPITDGGAPTETDFDTAWECLNSWFDQPNTSVYVHCRAGHERTGAILIACYARKHGVHRYKAKELLRQARPKIKLLPEQRAATIAWLSKHGIVE